MLWRTEQTCGKRLRWGGAKRRAKPMQGKGFTAGSGAAGGRVRKMLFGGKLP